MESLAMISNLIENGRDLTLDATQSARASSKPLDQAQTKKLLDSRNERQILEGLRQVVSMMCRGQDSASFFSSVVKNVASANVEIKKLVYLYLVRHAEEEPDLALLSINTIQRSLSDPNAQVRALALRTMSGIRVPVISQIVALAIRRGAADLSSLVRRGAALAVPKCYRLDPAQLPVLSEVLATLLADRQHSVAGAAAAATVEVCPDRLDLIHPVYRGLIRKLIDMDEWGQLATLRLLAYYARRCFPRQRLKTTAEPSVTPTIVRTDTKNHLAAFYDDNDDSSLSLDPDLELLLNGVRPLLHSCSSAVVVAVARCLADVGTPELLAHAVGPLVALMRSPVDVQQVALHNIVAVCLERPADFVPYAAYFLVRMTDSPAVWELKLEVLALIFPHSPARVRSLILHELEHFSRTPANPALVRHAVRAIGRCAQADPAAAARCLRLLLSQITSLDGTLAAESLIVIRHLIQLDPARHAATVVRLARNLDSAVDPHARATIIWLVGEFSGLPAASASALKPTPVDPPLFQVETSDAAADNNIAPDVLRILLRDFASEPEPAKLQIVLLAAKVYLHELNCHTDTGIRRRRAGQLWDYVLQLVRYDTSYDLRDRARTFAALLAVPQLATLMLLTPKPAPHAPSPSESRRGLSLGSATLVLGGPDAAGLRGYQPLPNWVQRGSEPDRRVRDDSAAAPAVPPALADRFDDMAQDKTRRNMDAGAKHKSLADWLAEGEEENGVQEEDESEDEDESEEESEEDDEDAQNEEDDEEDEDGEVEDGPAPAGAGQNHRDSRSNIF